MIKVPHQILYKQSGRNVSTMANSQTIALILDVNNLILNSEYYILLCIVSVSNFN